MSGFVRGAQNFVAGAIESPENKEVREKLEAGASIGKAVFVMVGLTSAALLAVSILSGGIFGFIGMLLFGGIAFFACEAYIVSRNISNLAKEPRHFVYLQLGKEAQEEAVKGLSEKMVEGTIFSQAAVKAALAFSRK